MITTTPQTFSTTNPHRLLSQSRSPPKAHGYEAKESLEHMLWEQSRWLDTYVKPQPSPPTTQTAAQ